jgi:hypothetical protein
MDMTAVMPLNLRLCNNLIDKSKATAKATYLVGSGNAISINSNGDDQDAAGIQELLFFEGSIPSPIPPNTIKIPGTR